MVLLKRKQLQLHGYTYLPSDKFSTVKCNHDEDAYYNSNTNAAAPSPYLTNDSRNPMYYTTSASSANALSDFSGFGNTKILTDLSTYQSDWKSAESITNGYSSGQYPAACCCWRYTANGKTDEGMWYLPACGELGYIMPKFNKIQSAIQKASGVQLRSNGYYWSSSEYVSDGARNVYTSNGHVYYYSKNNLNLYVRAFLRVG